MSAFFRAALAAAGVVALSANAHEAERLPQTFILPSAQTAEFAPALGLKTQTSLSNTALRGLFNSPFSSASLQSAGAGGAFALDAANSFNLRLDAVAVNRPSLESGYVRQGAASAISSELNWNFSDWAGASITSFTAQDQAPLFGVADRKSLGVSAYLGLGQGWVGSLSYSESQLDLKPVAATAQTFKRSSYGVAIAKHGLFGDDTLGLLLSRPAEGQSMSTTLNTVGASTIPSLYVRDRLLSRPADADIEVGYVTSFLDGTLAIQTNASYQLNFDSKRPDTVSLLSRAKIKF